MGMIRETVGSWDIELTDTFAGEANYCWVRRATIPAFRGETQTGIMRRAKAALEISGMPGRTERLGDGYEFRPYRVCQVAFVTWSDR